jgi:hypothetical protein
MKRISFKGLAQFMTASAAKQRTIVKQYKYPAEEEAHAKIIYYRASRDIIKAFHTDNQPIEFLNDHSDRLLRLSLGNTGATKIRLRNNSRAVMQYGENFGTKEFDVMDDVGYKLEIAGVIIIVSPDLHVMEKGVEKILKLDFDAKEPGTDFIKIMSQCLYEAALRAWHRIATSTALYVDVPRGKMYKGARAGSRTMRNIEASCQTLSDIWDSI